MRARSLVHLSPRALLDRLADLLAREREITAELILYLAEVLRRRLYLAEGYPSMHAYCVGALGMSEDSAGKRIRVVRMARRFPQILGMIADGRLHLSAVCLLSKQLTRENVAELLEAATHRTKRQIELMLAERFPQADVPVLVQALVPAAAPVPEESVPGRIWGQTANDTPTPLAACPSARVVSGSRSHPATPQPNPSPEPDPAQIEKSVPGRISESPAAAKPAPFPRVAPLAPQRYAVQFTMDQAMHDDLCRAQALLGHRVAPGEVTDVFRRALRELVVKLEKQKFAAASKPKTEPTSQPKSPGSRYVAAHVRRQVWQRDDGRCTFVSESGHRCESRHALEFDHIVPVARGGKSTPQNLRLRCHAHNQHEADQAFGSGFMHEIRERAKRAGAGNASRAVRAFAQGDRPGSGMMTVSAST